MAESWVTKAAEEADLVLSDEGDSEEEFYQVNPPGDPCFLLAPPLSSSTLRATTFSSLPLPSSSSPPPYPFCLLFPPPGPAAGHRPA